VIRICDLCQQREADLRFREITGWEQIRDQGGANKIIARVETPRRVCSVCLGRLRLGIALAQETLL
jgi:hypothetical protein